MDFLEFTRVFSLSRVMFQLLIEGIHFVLSLLVIQMRLALANKMHL